MSRVVKTDKVDVSTLAFGFWQNIALSKSGV
jgi:hypothetical protein